MILPLFRAREFRSQARPGHENLFSEVPPQAQMIRGYS